MIRMKEEGWVIKIKSDDDYDDYDENEMVKMKMIKSTRIPFQGRRRGG